MGRENPGEVRQQVVKDSRHGGHMNILEIRNEVEVTVVIPGSESIERRVGDDLDR